MFDLEEILAQYPVCQYEVLDVSEIPFSEKVRYICRTECERYGKSWSCPPAVGSVAECLEKCLEYKKALVFTTMAEVTDASIMEETLKTRRGHEKITHALCEEFRSRGKKVLALSAESCQKCEICAYPKECRHPSEMIPCAESFGILVTEIAEKCNIDFYSDIHTVTWFGLILFA